MKVDDSSRLLPVTDTQQPNVTQQDTHTDSEQARLAAYKAQAQIEALGVRQRSNIFNTSRTTNTRMTLSRLRQLKQQQLQQANAQQQQNIQQGIELPKYEINILDMIRYMENDKLLSKSHRLYQTYLLLAPTKNA